MTMKYNFLACPECHSTELTPTRLDEQLPEPYTTAEGFVCNGCGRTFPHVDGIYVLWSDQLKSLLLDQESELGDLSDKVKRANIEIYNEVTTEYGEHHDGSQPYAQTLLFLKAIANNFRLHPLPDDGSVLVDVGCATGVSLEHGSLGYDHVVGVDISMGNLRAVAKKGFIPVLADAEKLPFADSSIDLFTCFATLHHFPAPNVYVQESYRCSRNGGVTMIAGEPSKNSMRMSPIARLVWNARKPVYRFLGRFSERFYMHRNKAQQDKNDLAEINRTDGGFSPKQLDEFLSNAGFAYTCTFYGTDPDGFRKFSPPNWQQLVLRTLSAQNPLRVSNWMNLTAIGRAEKP